MGREAGNLADSRNIVQEEATHRGCGHQSFVNFNPLASFACQDGNPSPWRDHELAVARRSGGWVLSCVGRGSGVRGGARYREHTPFRWSQFWAVS
jgi:hypothetical protein